MAKFSVMVADHRQDRLEILAGSLEASEQSEYIDLHLARSHQEAMGVVRSTFLHLAIVLMDLAEVKYVERLLEELRSISPSCHRVLEVLETARPLAELVRFTSSEAPLADEVRLARAAAVPFIIEQAERWQTSHIAIDNLDELVSEILEKDAEYRLSSQGERLKLRNRNNPAAMAAEISNLMSGIFGHSLPVSPNGKPASLTFSTRRRGMSPSVAVEVVPTLGSTAKGEVVTGNHCWVKIGSVASTRNEALRYSQTVRFGIDLSARVEMLAVAYGDRLGAICYSVAGGNDKSVPSLDELTSQIIGEGGPDKGLSKKAIEAPLAAAETLFGRASSRWYSLTGAPITIKNYYSDDLGLSIDSALELTDESMKRLAGVFGADWNRAAGTLQRGDKVLRLPTDRTFGSPTLDRAMPTCLVHGDLHGGNIMVGRDRHTDEMQFSLIDFANSGYAPRCFDAGLLQGAFRIWDGLAFDQTGATAASAWQWVLKRSAAESQLLSASVPRRTLLGAPWRQLSSGLDRLLVESFPDHELPVARPEIVATYFMHAQRMLGLPLSDCQLLRIAAWTSALVAEVDSFNGR